MFENNTIHKNKEIELYFQQHEISKLRMSFTLHSWRHHTLLLLTILEYQTLEYNKKIDESAKIGL